MYSQYINYLTYMLDFTISQMTVTLKLCALAMNIQDGIAKTPVRLLALRPRACHHTHPLRSKGCSVCIA